MADKQRPWSREELILAFNLYLKIEFGKTHKGNPEVIALANIIGRTPSAVGMRLGNFASLDPYHQNRGIGGLKNTGPQVQQIWDEFSNNKEEVIFESERILAEKQHLTIEEKYNKILFDIKDLRGETKIRAVKTRVNQSVFRQIVMANYSSSCAITGIDIPDLLFASHILPWSKDENERLNPENGICLSALYDKAFDKGYIGFDENLKIMFSSSLKKKEKFEYYQNSFAIIKDKTLRIPLKYTPKKEFLEYHRDVIFDKT
jgi:putative restriction endonuclease